MIQNIGIIDYGMGNIHSVQKSLQRLNQYISLVKHPKDFNNCTALVLPGVGSFDPAMLNLKKSKLDSQIKLWVSQGKPLLGICLGLQLMFESSDEGSEKGLGLINGSVRHLPNEQNERIPHMGWALLNKQKGCPLFDENDEDYKNWVYFVHSYAAIPSKEDLAATVSFGKQSITAVVWKNMIGACQFHPEKSGKTGQRMLANWLTWLNKVTN